MLTRRQFFQRSAVVGTAATIAPTFLWRAKVAQGSSEGAPAAAPVDRTLVIVQMAGGNDALNMVVPYQDGAYHSARPTLGIDPATALPLTDQLALNPVMGGLKQVWDNRQLAIVEGVGYPQPSFSHFNSMAIWHTASPTGDFKDGWLGRFFAQSGAASNVLFGGINIGSALAGSFSEPGITIPSIQSPDSYKLVLDPRDAQARLEAWEDLQVAAQARQAYLPLIGTTGLNAFKSGQALGKTVGSYQPAVTYGKDPLSNGLRLLASVIVQEPGTKIGYVTIGGWDTHTNERRTQDGLLTTLSEALANFQTDIAAHGKADNVLLMTWSEFGRRIQENGGQGTDHGEAVSMMVMGSKVSSGIYGELPDLKNPVDSGNLKWTTDFRSVYATVLEDWLGVDSSKILGGRYQHIPFLAA
ncbi:MAG: DUF1501 domain-containing protein [Dehalococcoidia bacterium]